MNSPTYPTGGLDLLAIIVILPGDNCFSAVLVRSYGIRRELRNGVIKFFIIGPVRATMGWLDEDIIALVARGAHTLLALTSWWGY